MYDNTYIDKYIEEGIGDTIALHNLYDTILVSPNKKVDHIFRIPIDDFFIKYRKDLEQTIQFYHVPQIMYYKPKSLSFDIYGTTEMWLSILRLNNMVNITEFHRPVVQIYNPDIVQELISIFLKREDKW